MVSTYSFSTANQSVILARTKMASSLLLLIKRTLASYGTAAGRMKVMFSQLLRGTRRSVISFSNHKILFSSTFFAAGENLAYQIALRQEMDTRGDYRPPRSRNCRGICSHRRRSKVWSMLCYTDVVVTSVHIDAGWPSASRLARF